MRQLFLPIIVSLVLLADAYAEETVNDEERVVLRLSPALAPIKAAIFPLMKKEGMPEMARQIHADLQGRFPVFYDQAGSIGKRYRRQDEAGTPFCVTVDHDSLEDHSITVRDRDTLEQDRIAADQLPEYLAERISTA